MIVFLFNHVSESFLMVDVIILESLVIIVGQSLFILDFVSSELIFFGLKFLDLVVFGFQNLENQIIFHLLFENTWNVSDHLVDEILELRRISHENPRVRIIAICQRV